MDRNHPLKPRKVACYKHLAREDRCFFFNIFYVTYGRWSCCARPCSNAPTLNVSVTTEDLRYQHAPATQQEAARGCVLPLPCRCLRRLRGSRGRPQDGDADAAVHAAFVGAIADTR